MFPRSKIDRLLRHIDCHKAILAHNAKLQDIHDGNLLPYVKDELRRQFGPQAFKAAEPRIPPINVLQQLNDKMSAIYEDGVQRSLVSETGEVREDDKEIFSYLRDTMNPDVYFAEANRTFNLTKSCLLQPYLSVRGTSYVPAMRVITPDRFLPYSNDDQEPERADGFILMMPGEVRKKMDAMGRKNGKADVKAIYYAVEANEFCWFTEDGDDITPEKAPEAPDGFHDLGRIPLTYVNKSLSKLIPTKDTDMIAMTVLLPILLTDVNFVSAFQAFGFIYTLNVENQSLEFSPNAVWQFQQKASDERKPEVGTIKVSNDIDSMLNSAANQYALWLQTKGIKPGAVGDISASNFSSGVAKILDEMDTSSNRKKQVPFFSQAESDFWDLVLNVMVPYWRGAAFLDIGEPTTGIKVKVDFPEQVPMQRFGATVEETAKAEDENYMTWTMAMKRVHPHLNDDEIQAIKEVIENGGDGPKVQAPEPTPEPTEETE